MITVLFVCTGNVFRSLTAEYSLRRQIGGTSLFKVSSVGTEDDPELQVRADVADYLLAKGLDVSQHNRRLITDELISGSDYVIAMSTDHKQILRDRYLVDVPLFMEACGNSAEAIPDVDDLFAPGDFHGLEAQQHIRMTIDKIIDMTPSLSDQIAFMYGQN